MKKIIPILIMGGLVLGGFGTFAVAETIPIKLTIKNTPPDAPTITGPIRGKPRINYAYVFSTTDPEGDDVSYYVEWGDGTTTGWTNYYESGIDVSISHTWEKIDWNNIIRCKAKDIYGVEGDWSVTPVPINKAFTLSFLERVVNAFPLLKQLMGL